MTLADQAGEDIGGGAVVLDALGQFVALRLDPLVLGNLLLNVELLLLGDQPLRVHLLPGAAALRSDLEHVRANALADYKESSASTWTYGRRRSSSGMQPRGRGPS